MMIFPDQFARSQRIDPLAELGQALRIGNGTVQVSKHQRLAAHADIGQPARVRKEVPGARQPDAYIVIATHAVARVAITRAHHGEIDGEDQHLAAKRLRALQQLGGVATIAQHVKLEPERRTDRGMHLVHRADRDG